MQTNKEYEDRERALYFARIKSVQNQSLSDRRAARTDYYNAMKDPALIAERIGWLLNGSYGYSAQKEAVAVLLNKRINREAYLSIIIAMLEWNCPADFARKAWKELLQVEKKELEMAIHNIILNMEYENEGANDSETQKELVG